MNGGHCGRLIFCEVIMKKGDIGKGIIGESYFPDSAYIECDGEKVLIKKGIPGQMVEFVITKKKIII